MTARPTSSGVVADAPALEPPATALRDAPLRMSADEFRRAGHALVDDVAAFLASVHDGPVTPSEAPDAVHRLIGADLPLPEDGADAAALLRSAGVLLFGHSLLNGHPRFFGYITSSPAPIGMLGDLLAAAVNANVGAWRLSPVATEIEAQTVRWIADLVGYPASCGGLLVSGGNMANFIGLFAARAAGGRRRGARRGPRGDRRAAAARVRVGGDAYVDSESDGPGGPRHRRDPVDPDGR